MTGRTAPNRETALHIQARSASEGVGVPRWRFGLGRLVLAGVLLAHIALLTGNASGQPSASAKLPRVLLIGDSIRFGYAPFVAKRLEGKAEVISPTGAGDSSWLLENLERLVVEHKPDLVHFNVGLHDLRLVKKTKALQVPLAAYEKNLAAIIAKLKMETSATLVFATTTPIGDADHAKRKAAFDRLDADVSRYNEAAVRVMRKQGVVVHDLHHWLTRNKLYPDSGDGCHYTKATNELLVRPVVDCIQRRLLVRAAKPGKVPTANPEATPRYRKAEAERDKVVPARFKVKAPEFAPPKSAEEWTKRRAKVREVVVDSLGKLPPRSKPAAKLLSRELHPDFTLDNLTLHNPENGDMTAFLFVPRDRPGPRPAVLWLHSSSHDRHQLLLPGHNGGMEPLGETFAKAGYVVLAPDACWYGGRAGQGPAGSAETTREQHESLFKWNLWLGRTLWGMFVRDDQVALDFLCTLPEVDPKHIGATGISMGSTRSWWLAAVDERIACAVGVACLTRYENLLAHGQLRQHGVYYYVNGLLEHFDSEGVLALIAPRPFLALTGELDAGSPADGVRAIEAKVAPVYAALGAKERFRSVLYKDTGHVYTAEMRKEMLAWFARWLGGKP
jgi:dienelactone hydrolase